MKTPYSEMTDIQVSRNAIEKIVDGALQHRPENRLSMHQCWSMLQQMITAHEEAVKGWESFESRLTLFYKKYKPSNLKNVQKLVQEWYGRENELNERLRSAHKFDLTDIEPARPIKEKEDDDGSGGSDTDEVFSRLTRFYKKHNPLNIGKASILARAFAGREAELNDLLRSAYNRDLSNLGADEDISDPSSGSSTDSSKNPLFAKVRSPDGPEYNHSNASTICNTVSDSEDKDSQHSSTCTDSASEEECPVTDREYGQAFQTLTSDLGREALRAFIEAVNSSTRPTSHEQEVEEPLDTEPACRVVTEDTKSSQPDNAEHTRIKKEERLKERQTLRDGDESARLEAEPAAAAAAVAEADRLRQMEEEKKTEEERKRVADAEELQSKLEFFYTQLNPCKVSDVARVLALFEGDEVGLNACLRKQYNVDLSASRLDIIEEKYRIASVGSDLMSQSDKADLAIGYASVT